VIVEIGHLYNPMWMHTTCPNEMCYLRFWLKKIISYPSHKWPSHPTIIFIFQCFNLKLIRAFIMFIILLLKYWKWNYTYILNINSLICMYIWMHVHNYILWCNVILTSKNIQYRISEVNCFTQRWSLCDH
jgi:hypothetical protein